MLTVATSSSPTTPHSSQLPWDASLESYIGLVEAGVGLLPAGGGLKEIAVRASQAAGSSGDIFAELKKSFETVAMAKVSNSAVNAKELGLMRSGDKVVFNSFELLHIAKAEAIALAEGGYRPPLPARNIRVAGDVGIATFKMMLVNMLEGYFVSPYDYEIAERIATVVCGGKVDRNAVVDEQWILDLERKHFVELAQQEEDQDRPRRRRRHRRPLRPQDQDHVHRRPIARCGRCGRQRVRCISVSFLQRET